MKWFGIHASGREPSSPATGPSAVSVPAVAQGQAALGGSVAPAAASAVEAAPGTEIHYDANLIARFVDVHRQLAAMLDDIKTAAGFGRYGEAVIALEKLKVSLVEHLLEENVRLYTYLRYCLSADSEASELMSDLSREIRKMGRAADRFFKTYSDAGVDSTNVSAFLRDLDAVAAAITGWMKREEGSIYTLYAPPSQLSASV